MRENRMTRTYRIGVVGLTHDHVWGNLENLAASENGVLAAVAGPDQPALHRGARGTGWAPHTQ